MRAVRNFVVAGFAWIACCAMTGLSSCHHEAHVARPNRDAEIKVGPLTLDVIVDEDAARFHAVDQLSAWYPYHHVAFRVLAEPVLSEQEAAALAEYRALRKDHPWGSGLEAAYYLGRRDAIDIATRMRADAILAAFAARLAPFVESTQPHVTHFAATLGARLVGRTTVLGRLARLFGTPARTVPIVLVPRPGSGVGGGGANGGVLVVEVTSDEQSLTPLVHELAHALLEHVRSRIAQRARECGVDAMTFEEAIAHAVAPGLVHDGVGDPLATAGSRATARFYQLGLAVRPVLVRATDFTRFLDDTCVAIMAVDRP